MKELNDSQFSSRWGIILASLGMAIGAGNLWRFPRLAGQYGGSFIILWIVFLFIWSIPLLLSEFAIGKRFKKGVIGSYGSLSGPKYTFLGFFVAICTLGIAFYYAVVTAWAMRYFFFSISGFNSNPSVLSQGVLDDYWMDVSNESVLTIGIFIFILCVGVLILSKGIANGLEKANRILIPSLFVLIIVVSIVALNMPGGVEGLNYMFSIDVSLFSNPIIWIEALSQSAWSTGAGWGLLMTLTSYTRKDEEVTLNTFIGAFGNNTASLLAGMAILPAVFALATSPQEAQEYLKTGNQALTFTIIPRLFAELPGGFILSSIFFLALFLAAFSSLLPMIQLGISTVSGLGIKMKKGFLVVLGCFILLGFPSAYSLDFFANQDWVWGVGLILSGMFIAFAVVRYGVSSFKEKLVDQDSEFKVPGKYFWACITLNLPLGAGLIYWWLSRGYSAYPWFNESGYWNLVDVYSNASVVTQWLLVIVIGLALNRVLYRKFVESK